MKYVPAFGLQLSREAESPLIFERKLTSVKKFEKKILKMWSERFQVDIKIISVQFSEILSRY